MCDKKDRYLEGSKECLTQARQVRSDITLRKCDELKLDNKVLAMLSRGLLAAKTHWHHTCYRVYTNCSNIQKSHYGSDKSSNTYDKGERIALSNVYAYIRNELFNENCIRELSQVAEILKVMMNEFGVNEINTSTVENQEKANH